jgi:hypothetical protein
VPDLTAVRGALVGTGPASVVLRSFDGGRLAKGSVAVSAQGCDFDLASPARRFVQAAGRLYAGASSGGGWIDLTDVPAAAAAPDRLAELGLSDVTPYALAADPCRMLAIAATAGVVAESPDQGSFVLTLPGATIPGRDVLAVTARRLVPGSAAQLTLEIDVDAAHHPTRIRAFSGGVFDCEAQFQGWGTGPKIVAPSGSPPAPS